MDLGEDSYLNTLRMGMLGREIKSSQSLPEKPHNLVKNSTQFLFVCDRKLHMGGYQDLG